MKTNIKYSMSKNNIYTNQFGVFPKNIKIPCRLHYYGNDFDLIKIIRREQNYWDVEISNSARTSIVRLMNGGYWIISKNNNKSKKPESKIPTSPEGVQQPSKPKINETSLLNSYSDFIDKSFSNEPYRLFLKLSWNDITFLDYKINYQIKKFDSNRGMFSFRKIQQKWLKSIRVDNSRSSYNNLKSLFVFRNAEPIILYIVNDLISKIENIEVLNYYFLILENTNNQNEMSNQISDSVVSAFKHYNKKFYKIHLNNLLKDKYLNHLCELSDINYPIIPVAEYTVNSNGSVNYLMSFLFPISINSQLYWCWESIENGRATYLFNSNIHQHLDNAQILYNYLTGDTVNKRTVICNSSEMKHKLSFISRIMHNNFHTWQNNFNVLIDLRR